MTLVDDCLYFDTAIMILIQREKDAGSRCVISMDSNSTSIYDPRNPGHVKTFTFDLAYWSHSGFLKDENGMLISAGSNSYAGQVRFYSRSQLTADVSNTQL